MIKNLMPHKLCYISSHGTIVEVEPSGIVARVAMTQEVIGEIGGVPLVKTVYGDVTGVPDPQEGVIYVTSSLVASRLPERTDVVSPDTGPTAIRENGQIIAVTRFQKP